MSSEIPDSSLLHFWQWAFGDLCDDDIKGIFAEWVVYKLLNAEGTRRVSWANKDILVSGVKIEIKASAYWQSWKLVSPDGAHIQHPDEDKKSKLDKIVFKGLKASTAEPEKSPSSTEKRYKSDLYVFAFQCEESWERWNAMDLTQWEFYLVPVSELKYGSIRLTRLRGKGWGPFNAAQFKEEANTLIQMISKLRAEEANS